MFRFLVIAALAFVLLSCVTRGQRFQYVMDPQRTSNVIRSSSAVVTVSKVDAVETEFTLDLRVRPIVGPENRSVTVKAFRNSDLAQGTLEDLRRGEVIRGPDHRLQHRGRTQDGCDLVLIDEIPDQQEIEDLRVLAKVCEGRRAIPQVDVQVRSRGRNIRIGYNLR